MLKAMGFLDELRVRFLRATLAAPALRSVFTSRPKRLLVSFISSGILYLIAALYVPLWVLLLGPLVLGIPHLLASIRFTHKSLGGASEKKLAPHVMGLLLVAVAGYRLAENHGLVQPILWERLPNWAELAAMTALMVLIPLLYRKRPGLPALIAFAPLVALSYAFPFETLGALVLLHNLVAFAFWLRASSSRAERAIAIFCAAMFVGVSGAILLGAFDFTRSWLFASESILNDQINVFTTGQLVLPYTEDPLLLFRAVAAYAFGQSIHYFVWLKAIPEQSHVNPVPASFKRSYIMIRQDLGRALLLAGFALTIVIAGAWLFLNVGEMRVLYFALASFHGYLEIAALGFFDSRSAT